MESTKSIAPRDLIFFATFVLSNLRATVFFPLFPAATFDPLGPAWVEVALWGILLTCAISDLFLNKQTASYLDLWWVNKPLILFVLFAGLSVVWSVAFDISLFRWLELLCVTSLAVYFAIQYKLIRFFELLLWAGMVFVFVNAIVSLFVPSIGISSGFPYYGAWNGIFWHKNHFGALMCFFNVVNLFFVFHYVYKSKWGVFFTGFFYFVTLILIVLSKSATAVIGVLVLNCLFFFLQFWLNIRHKLRTTHYYFAGSVSFVALLFAYFNLDFLLGLLGKDRTLTGRSDLWLYLVDKVIAKQLWFGYGFGAFWNIQQYRVKVTQNLGWESQVLIADNGLLDVLIHVGIIGFVLFAIILLSAFLRSFKTVLHDSGNSFSFIPLFFLIFAVLVNISFSLFMETEVFIWMLMVYLLVVQTKTLSSANR